MARGSCTVEGCDRDEYGKGLCSMHWQRMRKHGDVNHTRAKRVGVEPCTVEGCEKLQVARTWCTAHWTRWKRYGSPTFRLAGEVVDGKRICPRCNLDKPLDLWGKNQGECKACSAARTAEYRQRNPYQPKSWRPCVCRGCGQDFLGNNKQRTYCSQTCRSAFKNRDNWKHLNNRRARLRAVWVESFDRREIFERDGWICGLCSERVDPAVQHPDPASASLDHVIPIALGGEHSRGNAQLAHLSCNVRKGARVLEEVPA